MNNTRMTKDDVFKKKKKKQTVVIIKGPCAGGSVCL